MSSSARLGKLASWTASTSRSIPKRLRIWSALLVMAGWCLKYTGAAVRGRLVTSMELYDPSTQSGKRRVFIDRLRPQIECGCFPIKRVLQDLLEVEVDLLVDGHDQLAGALLCRPR